MSTLTLYRGDFEKIQEFDVNKTNKNCLFGKGIYLTNSFDVANSYRTKGIRSKVQYYQQSWNSTLFQGEAKDRTDALSKAFERFTREYSVRNNFDGKVSEKQKEKLRHVYQQLIQEKEIVAGYTDYYQPGKPRTLVVEWEFELDHRVGRVTQFCFPRSSFEASMIKIDRALTSYNDPFLYEILGELAEQRNAMFNPSSRSLSISSPFFLTNNFWKKIQDRAEPFGYRGFEYIGGSRIGGYGNHRAFVVWDDEYVNRYKVKTLFRKPE